MLQIIPTESGEYHNFKCGEIFCLNPATYNVICCLCSIKVNIEQFPEHFQEELLAQMQLHPPDSKLEVRESIDTEFVKAGDLIKSEDNSDGGDDEPGFDTEILGNIGNELVDEQPIDFDELNPMETGENQKSLVIENNEHDNKTGEDTDPDWQNHKSSDDDSQKQNISNSLRYPCPDCTRSYTTRRTMLAHHRTNHNPNRKKKHPKLNFRYKCDECGEKFRLEAHLRGHRWKHTGIICDICGKTFTQPGNLVRHKMRHTGDKDSQKIKDTDSIRHPCPECMRTYKTRRSMTAHYRKIHDYNPKLGAPNKKYKCDECGEFFRSERDLRSHQWKHTGIVCDVCGRTFRQVAVLFRHKIRHTGMKAHKCEECGNDFFTEKELKAHMMRHTGKWPIVCEICGRRCRDHAVYKAHLRRHTGERPAKCEVCDKTFYSFHDLNVHAVTHSTARPFACDICGSTFQRKKSLRVHKKLHSKYRKHECKVCGRSFTQSSSLNAHLRTHDAAPSKSIGRSAKRKTAAISVKIMNVDD